MVQIIWYLTVKDFGSNNVIVWSYNLILDCSNMYNCYNVLINLFKFQGGSTYESKADSRGGIDGRWMDQKQMTIQFLVFLRRRSRIMLHISYWCWLRQVWWLCHKLVSLKIQLLRRILWALQNSLHHICWETFKSVHLTKVSTMVF